jgi:hypothetical protein
LRYVGVVRISRVASATRDHAEALQIVVEIDLRCVLVEVPARCLVFHLPARKVFHLPADALQRVDVHVVLIRELRRKSCRAVLQGSLLREIASHAVAFVLVGTAIDACCEIVHLLRGERPACFDISTTAGKARLNAVLHLIRCAIERCIEIRIRSTAELRGHRIVQYASGVVLCRCIDRRAVRRALFGSTECGFGLLRERDNGIALVILRTASPIQVLRLTG